MALRRELAVSRDGNSIFSHRRGRLGARLILTGPLPPHNGVLRGRIVGEPCEC